MPPQNIENTPRCCKVLKCNIDARAPICPPRSPPRSTARPDPRRRSAFPPSRFFLFAFSSFFLFAPSRRLFADRLFFLVNFSVYYANVNFLLTNCKFFVFGLTTPAAKVYFIYGRHPRPLKYTVDAPAKKKRVGSPFGDREGSNHVKHHHHHKQKRQHNDKNT